MPQPDQFWKELIERKNQEILDKFVESFDKPVELHPSYFPGSVTEHLNDKMTSIPPQNSKKPILSIKEQIDAETERFALFKKEFTDRIDPSPPPPSVKKDKMVEFQKEWKEITDKWGSPIKEIPVQNKSTTYYKPSEPFKFTVFDLNDQELGKVKTKQEAINLFMERYPQFDKKAIEPFIIEK
jgi:hypothetical protein